MTAWGAVAAAYGVALAILAGGLLAAGIAWQRVRRRGNGFVQDSFRRRG